jgi:lipopolysaccharide export system permease protein
MMIGFTLGRYLSLNFIRMIMMVFGTVFALVYTIDLVELLRRAGDAPNATAALMAQARPVPHSRRSPSRCSPSPVLFGSMAALLQLSRKLELVVARAAGISAWQFLQPGILVAALIGLLSVGAYNPVSAYLKQKASETEAQLFARNLKASSARISGSARGASTGRRSSAPRTRSSRPPPSPASPSSPSTTPAPSPSGSRPARRPCATATGR